MEKDKKPAIPLDNLVSQAAKYCNINEAGKELREGVAIKGNRNGDYDLVERELRVRGVEVSDFCDLSEDERGRWYVIDMEGIILVNTSHQQAS